ncbi:hypothetical protein SSTU70S_02910 [Stutzerimonas stutzeri]
MRQLAHIARPVVLKQVAADLRRELRHLDAEARGGALHEMREQQRDVFLALAQRRNRAPSPHSAGSTDTSRKSPRCTGLPRSIFDAATTRRLSSRLSLLPSGSIVRCSSTRSRRTCAAGGMLSISSRNSVPPLECSMRPIRFFCAPVNAPASWPNSSLSIMLSGSAPQFTATKLPLRRLLQSCSRLATASLPLPVSPAISTSTSVSAM